MKLLTIILLLFVTLLAVKKLLFSFSSQSPSDYAGTAPVFILKEHLSGSILSRRFNLWSKW